jgi:hypothetical protein
MLFMLTEAAAFATFRLSFIGPAAAYDPSAARVAARTQCMGSVAAPVMLTIPADVTEHPTLPAPSANVIAPVLFVEA